MWCCSSSVLWPHSGSGGGQGHVAVGLGRGTEAACNPELMDRASETFRDERTYKSVLMCFKCSLNTSTRWSNYRFWSGTYWIAIEEIAFFLIFNHFSVKREQFFFTISNLPFNVKGRAFEICSASMIVAASRNMLHRWAVSFDPQVSGWWLRWLCCSLYQVKALWPTCWMTMWPFLRLSEQQANQPFKPVQHSIRPWLMISIHVRSPFHLFLQLKPRCHLLLSFHLLLVMGESSSVSLPFVCRRVSDLHSWMADFDGPVPLA